MQILPIQLASFKQVLADYQPQFEVFAPGRVNLVGEHTDYNGGKVLPFAINLGISFAVHVLFRDKIAGISGLTDEPSFLVCSDVSPEVFQFSESGIRNHILRNGMLPAAADEREFFSSDLRSSWVRYVVGAIVSFIEKTKGTVHLDSNSVVVLSLSSNLPVGSGLSSSAAICCGAISALTYVFGVLMSADDIARLAMSVEHRFAGTKCGLMDQLAVMCSRAGHFTQIDFADFPAHSKSQVSLIKAHPIFSQYSLVAFHTGVSHSLANSAYNERRESCQRALLMLNEITGENVDSLAAYANLQRFKKVFRKARENVDQLWLVGTLRNLFAARVNSDEGLILAKRAGHAILENARVDTSVDALERGNIQALDTAMRASHASLRDDYEVSCRELDVACESARAVAEKLGRAVDLKVPSIIGARMTGGGFGGSTVQLVHNELVERFVEIFRYGMNPYTRETGSQPRIIVSESQNGLRIGIV
jgi:galactokinase